MKNEKDQKNIKSGELSLITDVFIETLHELNRHLPKSQQSPNPPPEIREAEIVRRHFHTRNPDQSALGTDQNQEEPTH